MKEKENLARPQIKNLLAKRRNLLIASAIAIIGLSIIGITVVTHNRDSASEQEKSEYSEAISNYNIVAEDYKKIRELASLKDASDLPTASEPKKCLAVSSGKRISKNKIAQDMAQIQNETEALNEALSLAQSIFNQKISEYNEAVKNYNTVADEYSKIRGIISLENIDSLPEAKLCKAPLEKNITVSDFIENAISQDTAIQNIGPILQDADELKDALALAHSAFNQKISEYNEAAQNYNAVMDEYKRIRTITALENIDGLPKATAHKISLEENSEISDFVKQAVSQDVIVRNTGLITQETEELLYALILAQQITAPCEDWVIERLKSIPSITGVQAVTKSHDPNQLLNVSGGYISCVYFSVTQIDQRAIQGTSIIDKGTDAGGAIEVYKTVTDAQNRCDYLGQFDNTLLYSGSYAIVGTTVIRTSYLLTNEQQVELTDNIATAFTALT